MALLITMIFLSIAPSLQAGHQITRREIHAHINAKGGRNRAAKTMRRSVAFDGLGASLDVAAREDAAQKKLTCQGVAPWDTAAQATWCTANCNLTPPHCPVSHCSCTTASEETTTAVPVSTTAPRTTSTVTISTTMVPATTTTVTVTTTAVPLITTTVPVTTTTVPVTTTTVPATTTTVPVTTTAVPVTTTTVPVTTTAPVTTTPVSSSTCTQADCNACLDCVNKARDWGNRIKDAKNIIKSQQQHGSKDDRSCEEILTEKFEASTALHACMEEYPACSSSLMCKQEELSFCPAFKNSFCKVSLSEASPSFSSGALILEQNKSTSTSMLTQRVAGAMMSRRSQQTSTEGGTVDAVVAGKCTSETQ